MSVYTPVSKSEIQDFLKRYSIGDLLDYQGIDEGIENTNYFVDTTKGRYVLTLFEHQSLKDLPYFLDLMAHIAEAGLPAPHPIADQSCAYLQKLCDKPAALIIRLDGHTQRTISAENCTQTGAHLAQMHLATKTFNQSHSNKRGLDWCVQQSKKVLSLLNEEKSALLQSEICYQQQNISNNIPHGTIHADLFRDNVLFHNNRLSGIIDFYYACDDALLYDLAITVNDWCVNAKGEFDKPLYTAMIHAYHQLRPLQDLEHQQWQNILRRAALRFWLSRLSDFHFPRLGEITHTKDPDFFYNILFQRRKWVPSLC